jgi:glucose/arabinose dehydrogenase
MRFLFCILLVTVIIMGGCSTTPEKKESEGQEASLQLTEPEVVASNLQIPWSIDQIDDTFYLSERPGHIVKVGNGKAERQQVQLEKPLATAAEAGLLGFVLASDFSATKEAFAYYTYKDSTGQFNRIVVLQLDGNTWREERVLLDQLPSGRVHHGGRLEIGPDGKLYATTGDAAENPNIAQELDSLGGKIIRMNLDGTVPNDNPFPNSYVYSYGHRNPQGLAWGSAGTLYESEHGPSANDEINRIQPGHNYGWPMITGTEKREGMETPLFTSGNDTTWAPSGMEFYDDKLYVATLRGNAVREFDLQTGESKEVITGLGRIRDVYIKDHYLYFVSNNTDGRGIPLEGDDKLYRIPLAKI